MLVNAAGAGCTEPFAGTDPERLTGVIGLNCAALTRMTGLCLRYMNRGSRIVNVASAAAFAPQPGAAVYGATKAYVLSLSRALARELEKRCIFVTAVCPGPVETEFFQTAGNRLGRPPETDGLPAACGAPGPEGCAEKTCRIRVRLCDERRENSLEACPGPADRLDHEQNKYKESYIR